MYNSSAACSVLPIENTIHGAVLESLDCLLNPSATSSRVHIIAETALSISHSLVGRRGTRIEDVEYVRSHEQALGQCSRWLDTHCPKARLGASDSTAGAAMELLDDKLGSKGVGAAICSKDVVDQHRELEVLVEGIQDRKRGCPNNERVLIGSQLDAFLAALTSYCPDCSCGSYTNQDSPNVGRKSSPEARCFAQRGDSGTLPTSEYRDSFE